MVIEPCVVYKAIYNYSFLDKEFLHSQYIYTNNKGAIYLTSVSLASLQRPLYPLIIFIIYLIYIFLLKLLDLGNLKSQYYNGAGARYLVRGSLKTWHIYIDVALLPSLAPQLNIFIIQHLFALSYKHLFKSLSRHLFNSLSRYIILSSPVIRRLRYLRFQVPYRQIVHTCERHLQLLLGLPQARVSSSLLLLLSSSSSSMMDLMQAFVNLQAQVVQLQAEVQFLRSIITTPF